MNPGPPTVIHKNPCYITAARPHVEQPIPPTTVHSPEIHGPPAESHTADPYSSNTRLEVSLNDWASTTHPSEFNVLKLYGTHWQASSLLVPPNPEIEERRPRREDRDDPTHCHQRRSKTPRPNPVYEEPVSISWFHNLDRSALMPIPM